MLSKKFLRAIMFFYLPDHRLPGYHLILDHQNQSAVTFQKNYFHMLSNVFCCKADCFQCSVFFGKVNLSPWNFCKRMALYSWIKAGRSGYCSNFLEVNLIFHYVHKSLHSSYYRRFSMRQISEELKRLCHYFSCLFWFQFTIGHFHAIF